MSSNIIGLLHNKSVSPSGNLEKVSGNLDNTKAPVVMIHQKNLDNNKEKEKNKNITSRGIIQDQSASSIFILSIYQLFLAQLVMQKIHEK